MIVLYIILGLIAGFFSGVLGIGGGVLVVPTLFYLFTKSGTAATQAMHQAIATSLCIMIFTSLASALTHAFKKEVLWKVCGWMSLGILIGAILGPLTSSNLSSKPLKIILALFEIIVGIYLLIGLKPKNKEQLHKSESFTHPLFFIPFGAFVGYGAAFLGIGGGIFVVPILLLFKNSSHRSIATSAICIVPIALVGTLSYLLFMHAQKSLTFNEIINLKALVSVSVATLIASPIGAHFCYKFSNKILRVAFAVLLIAIGILFFV